MAIFSARSAGNQANTTSFAFVLNVLFSLAVAYLFPFFQGQQMARLPKQ